ncbi:MAG: hypothetical protein ABW321_31590 [Polyangiales bacterium]
MITVTATLAPILVSALKDSYERCSGMADTHEAGDDSQSQEYLMRLWFLECEVREQYLALEKNNPKMIPYAKLWPESARELGGPPMLRRIK